MFDLINLKKIPIYSLWKFFLSSTFFDNFFNFQQL